MKKIILLSISLFVLNQGFSQDNNETATDSIKYGWDAEGKFTLQFNQTGYSDWQPGGDSSYSTSVSVNYDFNYEAETWSVDNKLISSFGTTWTEDDGNRKTDDRFELNTIYTRNEKRKKWSVSFFQNFKTQFADGFDYEDDWVEQAPPGEVRNNEDFPTSGLFKPAYWSFGPGYYRKKDKNFNMNIAPLTAKFTFLTGEVFEYNDDDPLAVRYDSSNDIEMYGVDPGESLLFELGLNIRTYYKFNLMKNISMENIITLYSNYLEDPKNVDIDYTMNLVMKINDVFSTNLTFQTVYDDNAHKGVQVREVFGLALNYMF